MSFHTKLQQDSGILREAFNFFTKSQSLYLTYDKSPKDIFSYYTLDIGWSTWSKQHFTGMASQCSYSGPYVIGWRSRRTSSIYDNRARFQFITERFGGVTFSLICCGLVTKVSPAWPKAWDKACPTKVGDSLKAPNRVAESSPQDEGGFRSAFFSITAAKRIPIPRAAPCKFPYLRVSSPQMKSAYMYRRKFKPSAFLVPILDHSTNRKNDEALRIKQSRILSLRADWYATWLQTIYSTWPKVTKLLHISWKDT